MEENNESVSEDDMPIRMIRILHDQNASLNRRCNLLCKCVYNHVNMAAQSEYGFVSKTVEQLWEMETTKHGSTTALAGTTW